ncbi:MAG: MFS transporter, partial [Curtobacterium sp.]
MPHPGHATRAAPVWALKLAVVTGLVGVAGGVAGVSGWLALQLSNSAFIVGVAAAASSFPILVLSLYGGVVADRNDKLKVVKIAQSLL